MEESEEELKRLLMRVKEKSESWVKTQHSKNKIMASDPITSWKIKWEKVEAMTDFLFLGSQIAVEDDYSHEIRRQLLLGRKDITNLDSVLKSKDITLTTKVCIVKTMVFPVVMYRCESWTIRRQSDEELTLLNCVGVVDS